VDKIAHPENPALVIKFTPNHQQLENERERVLILL
jgi:hypothetical protein